MTQTELKNILQLLHSKDPQNAILAISLLWGFEEIPQTLLLALGLVCYLEKDEGITAEAEDFLREKLRSRGFFALTKSLLVLVKAYKKRHVLLRQPEYAILSDKQMLQAFGEQQSAYASIVSLHPYYLDLYLKAGIFWTYESQIPATETSVFFENVLQFFPQHPYALFGMAHIFEKQPQQAAKAIEIYQLFLTHHPKLGHSNQIITDYPTSVYVILPTSFNAFQRIAHLLQFQLHDYKKALSYYEKAKMLVPKHLSFAFRDAAELIWFQQENPRRAMNLIEEGLTVLNQTDDLPKTSLFTVNTFAISIEKANLHELAGDIFAEEKRQFDVALSHYKKALQINPALLSVRLKQIRLTFNQFKDYWQVEQLCKQALQYSPKHFEVNQYLEKAKQATGRSKSSSKKH